MTELLKSLRKQWGALAQVACWIAVTVGTFAPQPPPSDLTAPPDEALKHFAQFLGAVLIGILAALCHRFQERIHLRPWMVATAIMAALLLGTFLGERAVRSDWTCRFAGKEMTIGAELTDDARAYRAKRGGEVTCSQLLADYGGDAFQIWHRADAERHYLWLSELLIAIWLCAAACIVCVTQVVRCAVGGPNRAPAATRAG